MKLSQQTSLVFSTLSLSSKEYYVTHMTDKTMIHVINMINMTSEKSRNKVSAHYLHFVQGVLSSSLFISILLFRIHSKEDLEMHWHKRRKIEVVKYLAVQ